MNKSIFLKQNVKMEPLWNQWYATTYLLQPAAAGCITAKLHMAILESYIQNPHLHQLAYRDSAMRGGPFMNYSGDLENVKNFIEKTRTELASLLELSSAISDVNNMLEEKAEGFSLEAYYEKIPEILRGYIELGYDLNNHPSIRFIESLLYMGPLYKTELQSITLSLINDDERSFVFSTPRLEIEDELNISIPFSDPLLDKLFKMKFEAGSADIIDAMVERFGLNETETTLLDSFFTTEPPKLAGSLDDSGVRVRYFGHATILIQTDELSILTDPLISYNFEGAESRYTFEDLPNEIDYVLLTHNHLDHIMLETLLQIRHKIKTIICPKNGGGFLQDPSIKLALKAIGFDNVFELDELEELAVNGGRVVGIPFFGEHGDLHIRSKIAYFIELKNRKILCAADSNTIEPKMYELLRDFTGPIDNIFIGMECTGAPVSWTYGPLFHKPLDRKMDQTRRLDGSNCERAMKIVEYFSAKNVYVYAMGMEPWLNFIVPTFYTEESAPIVESNTLVAECEKRDIFAKRLNYIEEINL